MRRILIGVFLFVAAFTAATAQSTPKTDTSAIMAKRPVLAGACHYCPWGAIADVVKNAMKPYGYDVQVCYVCEPPRYVGDAKEPETPATVTNLPIKLMGPVEPLPKGRVDFGATSIINLRRAYQGTEGYAKDGPRKDIRIFAVVDYPSYLLVAATKESGITDLIQLKGRTAPLRVLVDQQPQSRQVLAYYGLNDDSIKAAGGTVRPGGPQTTSDFDLIIYSGTLSNAPEQAVWYTLTQKYDLVFLNMPEELIAQLAKDPDYERVTAPLGLLKGLDHNIPTVVRRANAVFGRADAPDSFAYAVAKALDEQQDMWEWAPIPLYYNPRDAWKTLGLPLHPGAAKYYREKGYMK